MKHITILVPETAVLASITDPRYLFTAINQFLISSGREAIFKLELVGMKKEIHLDGVFTIHTDQLLKDVKKTDLIIIPAVSGDLKTAIDLNKKLLPWIIDQHRRGAEVVSLCLGAFLLASTGLLDGKKCSTHWLSADQFRSMFPEVELVDGSIITEQNGLYSSGGATSYWNLLLYLVEKYTDREMAILASKFFAIEIDRTSQSVFMMFNGQKEHEDDDVVKVQEYIEKNFQDKVSVDHLAYMFGIGRRSLERRFKKATRNTVIEYIQRVKIEAAKKSFELGRKNVTEVMYDVGYNDNKAFRTLFKNVTGLSPIEYRNRYNRTMMQL